MGKVCTLGGFLALRELYWLKGPHPRIQSLHFYRNFDRLAKLVAKDLWQGEKKVSASAGLLSQLDTMLRLGPSTEWEIAGLIEWCQKNGIELLL